MNTELNNAILEEIKKDFPLNDQVIIQEFTKADAFMEMARDYYKCKKLIAFMHEKNKKELAIEYEELFKELKKEIKTFILKK